MALDVYFREDIRNVLRSTYGANEDPVTHFCARTCAPCAFAKKPFCIECVYDIDIYREGESSSIWEDFQRG